MFISMREAQAENEAGEHMEHKGRPTVYIAPSAGNIVQKAVDELSSLQPGALNEITDIIIDNQDGAFGTYASDKPHTVYLNLSKIESEVRKMLGSSSGENYDKEMLSQVMQTILHEATHEKVYQSTNSTSEAEPERKEEELRNQLKNTLYKSNRRSNMLKMSWDAEFQNLIRKLDSLNYDTSDLEGLMEVYDDEEWAEKRPSVLQGMKGIVRRLTGTSSIKNYKKIITAKIKVIAGEIDPADLQKIETSVDQLELKNLFRQYKKNFKAQESFLKNKAVPNFIVDKLSESPSIFVREKAEKAKNGQEYQTKAEALASEKDSASDIRDMEDIRRETYQQRERPFYNPVYQDESGESII
jgi:hypothetical protein